MFLFLDCRYTSSCLETKSCFFSESHSPLTARTRAKVAIAITILNQFYLFIYLFRNFPTNIINKIISALDCQNYYGFLASLVRKIIKSMTGKST